VKKSVWLSVVVFLLAAGCALRSEAPLTPRELAGRAKAVEWEPVTRSGESASPRRVADPRILACLLGYLKEATTAGLPGNESWSEYRLSFELRDGRKVQLKYVVRKFSRCEPGYLQFLQGWYEVPGQFNILVEALTGYPDASGDVDPRDAAFLRRYGWTPAFCINTLSVTLPAEFRHRPGEYPVVLYWAYNNELNRDVGLDLTPVLGRAVEVRLYKVAEPLPEFMHPRREAGRAAVVRYRGEIVGAWLDAGSCGFACSLRGRRFEEAAGKTWEEWIASLVDPDDPLERELARLSPEGVIRAYFEAVDRGDFVRAHACESRRLLTSYLFCDMDGRYLYNPGYRDHDVGGLANITAARVLAIERLEGSEALCPPGALRYMVSVDLQVKELVCFDSGPQVRFVLLRRETPETGWRIEAMGTS
jgi:hypothetical protein